MVSPACPSVRPTTAFIVTAAAETIPEALLQELAEEGVGWYCRSGRTQGPPRW